MLQIIQKRKIWLSLSTVFVVFSIFAILIFQLNAGIDFTGGTLLELSFAEKRPSADEINSVLADLELGSLIIQPVDEKGLVLRFQNTSEEKHQEVMKKLNTLVGEEENTEETDADNVKIEMENATGTDITVSTKDKSAKIEELRYDSVGPTIGQELRSRSITAIIVVLIAIVLYIAWAFRKVSKPVASWKFGITAIIALFHDVIITIGVFSILGELYNIEVNTAFVAAILTVLGYSVNDTIVVFDRIRENLQKSHDDFEDTVNKSVNQTIRRSINTSVTTLVVLLAVLFFGGNTIKDFILALTIGVMIGTYSSIFLASPILVVWEKMKK